MDETKNGSADSAGGVGVWSWDYMIACFAEEKVCVSFVLWLLSCIFWLTSCSIQINLRCTRKSSHEATVFWDIYRFFGSMCNTIGALLSKQLTIQVITGFYMALTDVVHFLLTLFPVCTYKDRPRSNHRSRTRKKSILSALSVTLFAVVGYNLLNAHNFASYDVSYIPQRRLLESALQERTDIVGFMLGIIAVIVSWTARVPLLTKVKSWTPLNMIPDRGQNIKKALGRYVRLSIEQVQEVGSEVRLPGDGENNTGTNNEPICYLDLPLYPPDHVTLAKLCSTSSSEVSSSNNELEWDFEDINPQWSNNSHIPSIHPKDSSVLSTGTEQQLAHLL
ncbi:hypothetical protein XENTR_v10014459 [Xenopus tropicalis]|nr:hypothetical protein XENTR_v10014459 [Xenopus tropicalis]